MLIKFFLSLFGIQHLTPREMVNEALSHSNGCDVGAYLTIERKASRRDDAFVIVGPDGDTHRLPVKSTGVAELVGLWAGAVNYYRDRQAATPHPDAFVDTQGFLRQWNTANRMPEDWVGIAKDSVSGFLAVCRHAGKRSIHKLRAESLADARREVAVTMCFSPAPTV